jgi:hypothetical protein
MSGRVPHGFDHRTHTTSREHAAATADDGDCFGDCGGGGGNGQDASAFANPSVGHPIGSFLKQVFDYGNWFESIFGGGSQTDTMCLRSAASGPIGNPSAAVTQAQTKGSRGLVYGGSNVSSPPVAPDSRSRAPPSACSEYDKECAASADEDLYACGAGDCCRGFGSSPRSHLSRRINAVKVLTQCVGTNAVFPNFLVLSAYSPLLTVCLTGDEH